jgi:exportin-T
MRECKKDVGPEIALKILEGVRDLLALKIELPELENPEEQDLLTEATSTPPAQLYLFETVGTLVSFFAKAPEQQTALLRSVVQPLLDTLQAALQTPVAGAQDVVPILTAHRAIMALGSIAKGFPDYPSPATEGYLPPAVEVFQQMANAILVSLDAMNVYKVVREAVCPARPFSFEQSRCNSAHFRHEPPSPGSWKLWAPAQQILSRH